MPLEDRSVLKHVNGWAGWKLPLFYILLNRAHEWVEEILIRCHLLLLSLFLLFSLKHIHLFLYETAERQLA